MLVLQALAAAGAGHVELALGLLELGLLELVLRALGLPPQALQRENLALELQREQCRRCLQLNKTL